MRIGTKFLAAGGCLLGGAILFASPPSQLPDQPIQLRDLSRYVRITQQPFEMHDSTTTLCRAPVRINASPHQPAYPKAAYCNVYVNPVAKATITSGSGVYPEGSLVIKSKLATADSQTPDLYTVMKKMAEGYDTDNGNWKYIVVDGETYQEIASGRVDSCIACHTDYKETDYITREYINDDASGVASSTSEAK